MLLMVPSSCQAWPPPAWGQQKYTAPPMPSGKGMDPDQIIYISLSIPHTGEFPTGVGHRVEVENGWGLTKAESKTYYLF